ncbi:DHH family phosphoesterase [Candidatus Woesearchaeota archaeon]|nr:DHH family phosphoesterase [Candidatus Woesearchaeota archaeon]
MTLDLFLDNIKKAASDFNNIDKKEHIRVISNYDSDGLTSAALLTKALKNQDRIFSIRIIKQLTNKILKEISLEQYNIFIFADLGSSSVDFFNENMKDKKIFILDHHQIKSSSLKNGFFINPLLFDIDGSKEISAAGVSYLFTKSLDSKNEENAHIAIIGAIGDSQENKGFIGVNNLILEDAKKYNLEVRNGLRLFGAYSRPIHKVLQFSTDPYIPGITGDEQAVISFLEEIGINFYSNGKYKKLHELTEIEFQKLTSALLMKLSNHENQEDIFGPVYLLKTESDDSLTKDLKEFSTLLNCAGRLNKPSIGIGLCLNDKYSKEKAQELIIEYRKEITNGLEWFYNNRNKENIIEHENFILINAQGFIRDSLIGTLTSMISRSGIFNEGLILISMAYNLDGNIKISTRISSYNINNINVKEILESILNGINAEIGGHNEAAGAIISQADEDIFIKKVKEYFTKNIIENMR